MMGNIFPAISAELIKLRHTRMRWVSVIAFGLGPIMGGLFMIILSDPEMAANAPGLQMKAGDLTVDWNSYLGVLSQVMGVGGVLVFGFVASWIFGREYSDNAAKDMLALPVSRTTLVAAKYVTYIIWCGLLALSNLVLGLAIGSLLGLPEFSATIFSAHMYVYGATTLLTIGVNTPVAFFAISGRGYLAPLAFVALILALSQIIAAAGYGPYFPWAVPGLYSGTGGTANAELPSFAYIILWGMGVAGCLATAAYMRFADHSK